MNARAAAVYGLAAVATLALAGTGAAHYGGASKTASSVIGEAAPAGVDGSPRAPRVRLANSGGGWPFSFLESLFGAVPQSEPRRSHRPERPLPRPAPRALPPQEPAPASGGATYRTMCVRLCDGYYWPVSFATYQDQFGRDAETCGKSCGASVALYYYPNPGGAPEDMVSLEGRPYRSLGTAFLYRTIYDPSCKCRAHPWESAALERHKGYAKSDQPRSAARRSRRRR